MKNKMPQDIEASSGNVFADLGFENADELAYKADLVLALKGLVKRRGMTQVQAAAACGTDQGTISKVLRGRIDLVTTDRLLRWIRALGASVQITVQEIPDHQPAPVTVRYCPA